ncbi:uncharacterized protein WCI35_024132 [Daubentonia madagascariensis]|uniref:Uncharacterized protein n=1 Tax=Daubentonia madagascariensis TaxID=31869 RepID=A0ABD2DP02_DAUMA
MSSPDEVSVWGAVFGPEGGEQASVGPAGPGAPRGPGLGLDLGAPRSGEGEGALADPDGLEAEREVIEAGGAVLWGREGRPGTPTDEKGDDLDDEPHLADESVAIVQPQSDWDARGVRRHPSPEGRDAEVSAAVRADLEAGPSGRGAPAASCGESQPAPAAPARLSVPWGGRAWGNPKRGAGSRLSGVDLQRPSVEGLVRLPSDTETPDEFSEIQMVRVNISPKEGGQDKPSSPEEPGDTPRHSNLLVRENFPHMPGSFPTSAPRGLASAMERQAVGELDSSSSKKMQSVVWGKGGSRPSFPGAAAAAAGSLPRAIPRKKVAQEKKSLGGASKLALGRTFPSWGQRLSAVPLEPATFPPIAGVPLLGRSKRHSLLSSGPKQSKHSSTGKKSVARKAKESQPVARDDTDPNRDPVPKAQLPTPRPGPPGLCMHRGEFSSGSPNTRAPHVPGHSQASALSQGGVPPRGPAPSGDQEPPVHAPRPERQQQPPGAQGCPRCVVLQREIDDLKEQLAAMQSLADKFQAL